VSDVVFFLYSHLLPISSSQTLYFDHTVRLWILRASPKKQKLLL